ncbi:portal protein [Gordonia phage Cleo]|nr:portal protein [Gordonia phage Cleo]
MSTYSTVVAEIHKHSLANLLVDGYYEGDRSLEWASRSKLPPLLQKAQFVVGWPTTTVDVLHERLDWRKWYADAKYGLDDVYMDNHLDYESELGHLDSLLYGTAFGVVGTGDTKIGEPEILVTVESAKHMAGIYDRRRRRMSIAASKGYNDAGEWVYGTLYEADQNTYYERNTPTSPWKTIRVDKHNLGRVPVVQFVNRARAGRRQGKSEITRAVRSYTNMAVRTLVGMEVNREFFSSPQRYALGAKEDAFVDENGQPIPGWKAILGSLWNLERDEEWAEQHPDSDGLPTIGQFPATSPGPYIDQIEGLSKMFAAEVGIPPGYLGFVSEQPPSADAIRALEARLVKRAQRRITSWNMGWTEVGQIVAMLKTGDYPAAKDIVNEWGDPAVPATASDTDRAVKLVGAQIIPADSSVTQEIVGLSIGQRRQLERDQNRAAVRQLLLGGDDGNGSPSGDGTQPGADDGNGSGDGSPNAPVASGGQSS